MNISEKGLYLHKLKVATKRDGTLGVLREWPFVNTFSALVDYLQAPDKVSASVGIYIYLNISKTGSELMTKLWRRFLGGERSSYIPRDSHDGIREYFPAAEFEYVADAGHCVHMDNPEGLMDKLLPFLEDHGPGKYLASSTEKQKLDAGAEEENPEVNCKTDSDSKSSFGAKPGDGWEPTGKLHTRKDRTSWLYTSE